MTSISPSFFFQASAKLFSTCATTYSVFPILFCQLLRILCKMPLFFVLQKNKFGLFGGELKYRENGRVFFEYAPWLETIIARPSEQWEQGVRWTRGHCVQWNAFTRFTWINPLQILEGIHKSKHFRFQKVYLLTCPSDFQNFLQPCNQKGDEMKKLFLTLSL